MIEKKKNDRNKEFIIWFDENCKNVVDKRNEARRKMLQRETRLYQQKYVDKRKTVYKICKRKKRKVINRRMIEIENDYLERNIKDLPKSIRKVKEGFKPKLCIYIHKQRR